MNFLIGILIGIIFGAVYGYGVGKKVNDDNYFIDDIEPPKPIDKEKNNKEEL